MNTRPTTDYKNTDLIMIQINRYKKVCEDVHLLAKNILGRPISNEKMDKINNLLGQKLLELEDIFANLKKYGIAQDNLGNTSLSQ